MYIEDFKAGSFEQDVDYSCFVPDFVNRQWEWKDPQLNTMIEMVSLSLGELNSVCRLVPDIGVFKEMHIMKEAVTSSRLEGTQINIDEALMPEDEISPEKRTYWLEVRNYSEAMKNAVKELEHQPVTSRLLCKTHKELLSGLTGTDRLPGEFRRSQNRTGGESLSEAAYIPPHYTYIDGSMVDLESFLNNENTHVPAIVRIGIAHYQFGTILPFQDCNGRIGRLLIALYLASRKIAHQPLLCLSSFFERNKGVYYDNLVRVREKNDLMHWLKYFLNGVDETAQQASNTLSKALNLKEQTENSLRDSAGRRTPSALVLVRHLFREPVINVKRAEAICDLSTKAANDLVSFFVQRGILKEISGKTRYRLFSFDAYLSFFR
jgi:Fic family protein